MIVLHNGRNVTDYISVINWGGSKSEVARKLELTVINAPNDKNIPVLVMGLADTVSLFEDDGATERFRGFITDREASSVTGTVSYTAYDILYYATKSKGTYNFSGKPAEAITQMVCSDVGIPVGSLASTGLKQKLIVQDKTIYDIIMQAYTNAHKQNGRNYYATAKRGLLNVEEMGKVVLGIELTEDSNITSSKYKETLNNMVNKVKIYDGEGNPVGVVQNGADVSRYGVFQATYTKEKDKDAGTVARGMFKSVEKTFELQCVNYSDAVTGAGAIIRDRATGLNGIVWIDSDTHTWTNGVATMNLSVTLKQVMDTREE